LVPAPDPRTVKLTVLYVAPADTERATIPFTFEGVLFDNPCRIKVFALGILDVREPDEVDVSDKLVNAIVPLLAVSVVLEPVGPWFP
jgi:hypothetical protein